MCNKQGEEREVSEMVLRSIAAIKKRYRYCPRCGYNTTHGLHAGTADAGISACREAEAERTARRAFKTIDNLPSSMVKR